jgi:hypothetical protein
VSTIGQRGIALAPDSRQTIDLARYSSSLDAASVHVHATAGLVTAAVETSRVEGVTPAGSEWLPAASPPATETVVDAAVDGATQELQIVNPGDLGALVQVEVVEEGGSFVPSGLEGVRVPPESVKTVQLGKITHKKPVAVRLTSQTPVTGAVLSTTEDGADYAVSTASPPVDGFAVVPVIPDAELSIAATGASRQTIAQLQVTGYDSAGAPVFADTVTVDGLQTTSWTMPDTRGKKKPAATYLVIAGSLGSDAQAIAVYSGTDGVASVPVVPGVFSVTRPSVSRSR